MARPNIHTIHRTLGQRFRTRRMVHFIETLGLTPETTVLDVGGSLAIWASAPVRPRLTLLNLSGRTGTDTDGMTWIEGDARCLPFDDQSFDIVFSNSVIEHVGCAEDQARFAAEVRRVGRRHYVQTPNRWFPIEPHYLTPFIHWLPKDVRRRLLRNGTVWGWITRPTPEQCCEMVDEIRLLDRGEMTILFPDAEIITERAAGLPKSLIAVKK